MEGPCPNSENKHVCVCVVMRYADVNPPFQRPTVTLVERGLLVHGVHARTHVHDGSSVTFGCYLCEGS